MIERGILMSTGITGTISFSFLQPNIPERRKIKVKIIKFGFMQFLIYLQRYTKKFVKYFVLPAGFFLLSQNAATAQSREVKNKQEKSSEVKEKQKREIERTQKKLRKKHYKRQTKKVRQRMKESRESAKKFNRKNRKNWFERWRQKRRMKKNR
jgi:flagellar biosynthesis GTPase FlhF